MVLTVVAIDRNLQPPSPFAMGYCGHGVANSLYFGHHLANLMRGRPMDRMERR